ncbi:MAG: phosphotransferase, partial [Oscillospiraceae bacterium]|nr:phosphotransferase [Oscillospiraceae bacterium]
NRKTDYKIQKYHECGLRFGGGNYLIDYIEKNRALLENRPQCFQHGDYHTGNMMLENDVLKIIDFDRYDFGDPWEEFNRIVFSAKVSPHFATGQLRGYFGGGPPAKFFDLLTFYISVNALAAIPWAIPFGQADVDIMVKQTQDILSWFDNMQNPVPSWYIKDFYIQWTDGIPYKLKKPHDFTFLSKYGKVFKVFDDQDSGNICFCVINGEKRYFIKFAGAATARACVGVNTALKNLKTAVSVYWDLKHPSLINILSSEEIGGGYAAVYDWVDAECMGRMYPLSRKKFMQLSLKSRIKVFEEILVFHDYIADCGYVAVDFYDGSIMYDFKNEKAIICDIDFYVKTPYRNPMGRLWGSGKFMSPEEFAQGAEIDEVTNVYAMGATAFALFSDFNRTPSAWPLNIESYNVVKKAVCDERDQRLQSIEHLYEEWKAALNDTS